MATTQDSCLGNPKDRGAWPAMVHGIARVRRDLATKQQLYNICVLLIHTYIYVRYIYMYI